MTENKRFKLKYINEQHISANLYDDGTFIGAIGMGEELIVELLNDLSDENEQLKQQRKELLRLIDNNIEIYENINTNVEFHQGEIQGKLTLLNNLRKVILND